MNNKMNFQEIIEKCRGMEMTNSDIGYGDFDTSIFGKIELVHSQGGEGRDENWERVYHFVDHNIYISQKAWYQSYNGAEFDGYEPTEVFPSEKTITVYE